MRTLICVLLIVSCSPVSASEEPDELLTGVFLHLKPEQRPVITITNNGNRDIDDIMMGISLRDEEGIVLFSTGYTDMVTGSVWLAAGATMEMSLFITEAALDRNPTGKQKLMEEPETIGVTFDIQTVTFIQ